MKCKNSLLTISLIMFFTATDIEAADIISVSISTKDQNLNSPVQNEDHISGSGLHKLYAYIKIESDTANVKPNKLYLEWVRSYDGKNEVLSNYNTDKHWLIYERRLNVVQDFYRVHKTVFSSNPGQYELNVYNKNLAGEYVLIQKAKTIIEGEDN